MQMQMIDRLAAIGSGIDDDAVALRQTFLPSYLRRGPHQVTEESSMFGASLGERADVLSRNDQDVHRRFRIDVSKCVCQLVLVYGGRGNLTGGDFAKDSNP